MNRDSFDAAFESFFGTALKESLDLISKFEYAGAFMHFSKALARVEETHLEYAVSDSTQAQLRIAVKRLWDSFIRHSKDRRHMSIRMDAHKPTEQEIAKAMAASREPSKSDFRRYLSGRPEDQRQWNEHPRGSAVRRKIIHEYLDRITSPIAEAYEGSRRQIFYIGALYNHTLPQITVIVAGMAQQLFPPKPGWRVALGIAAPEPKRIQVTARAIRAEIADFLAFAERSALELAELELRRDQVRDTLDE